MAKKLSEYIEKQREIAEQSNAREKQAMRIYSNRENMNEQEKIKIKPLGDLQDDSLYQKLIDVKDYYEGLARKKFASRGYDSLVRHIIMTPIESYLEKMEKRKMTEREYNFLNGGLDNIFSWTMHEWLKKSEAELMAEEKRDLKYERVKTFPTSGLSKKVLGYIAEHPRVRIDDVAREFNLSYGSAAQSISRLNEQNKLQKQKEGKKVFYSVGN